MGIASGINNSVVALWKRVGTVISPKTDGDDITTTGTFSGINVTSGESPGHTHDNSYYTETEVDSNYLAIDGSNADQDIDIGSYNLTTAGDLDVGDISLSKNIYHSGTITAVGTKYVQHYLHIDGYYKTDPEDANVLGWDIDLPITADSFNKVTLSTGAAGVYNAFMAGSNPVGVTGDRNYGIGEKALDDLEDGNTNFALGASAGEHAVSVTGNNLIGYKCGQYTEGDFNSYYGNEAGLGAAGVDSGNTGIGAYALTKISSGDDDVALGLDAGSNLTTGSRNTFIGRSAGGYGTIGSGNVYLGCRAGFRQTTVSNLLIIDNQDRASIANELTNSLIVGTFNATPSNQTLRLNAAVTIPYTLDVTGLGTFGNLDVDTLNFNGNEITDSTGTISFDDDDLTIGGKISLSYGAAGSGTILNISAASDGANNLDCVGGYAVPSGAYGAADKQLTGLNFGTFNFFTDVSGSSLNLIGINTYSHGTYTADSDIDVDNLISLNIENQRVVFGGNVTANNAYGIKLNTCVSSGTGTIVNEYGLYIGKPTLATNNYQVKLNSYGAGSGIWFDAERLYSDGTNLTSASPFLALDKIKFTQTDGNEYIDSLNTGYVDYGATTAHRFNNLITTHNVEPITDDTYYVGRNDDDSPKAYKGIILADTTDGKYYRIEITSGSIVVTDLTD